MLTPVPKNCFSSLPHTTENHLFIANDTNNANFGAEKTSRHSLIRGIRVGVRLAENFPTQPRKMNFAALQNSAAEF
ncbi:MAG TPA: hypothetical protein PKV01_04060 [Anaerolineales bacterium]|nr:hypothetical protein [Anaerolineales bacterium]